MWQRQEVQGVLQVNARQQRFVEEYLVDLNATQAAIRAGYSAKTANEQGAQLLAKLSIQEAIEAAKAKRSERTAVTAEDVVLGLLQEAKFTGEGSSHSARVSAWSWLGRHLSIFEDKVKVSGSTQLRIIEEIFDGSDNSEGTGDATTQDQPAPI